MSGLRDAIDHTMLGWIKPELDEVLRQARIELEGFVDAPDDPVRYGGDNHIGAGDEAGELNGAGRV